MFYPRIDFPVLGEYSWGGLTGIIGAAISANSELYQFWWSTSGTTIAVIRKVTISAVVSTTFFAAGVPVQLDMVKATSWTAQGTGGTAITPAATLKRQSTMASTIMAAGDMRIATTAALGAGTKTLEGNSLAAIAAAGPITNSLDGTILKPVTLWEATVGDSDYPLVLAGGEGFVIRAVAVPATGTWTLGVNVQWSEATRY